MDVDTLKILNEVGIALSKESDIDRLLEIILLAAKEITNADGASLYNVSNRKLVFKDENLIGAVLIGRVDNAGVLANLMRKRVDVTAIKKDLLDGRFDFATVAPLIAGQPKKFREDEYRDALLG